MRYALGEKEHLIFPTRILMATDGSEGASMALRAAVELADGTGSELHLVHVVPIEPEPPRTYSWVNHSWAKERSEAQLESKRLRALELLDDQARRVEEELGGSVTATHYREGRLEKEVVRLGEEIDAGLIVAGGRGRPWFARVFGAGFSERIFWRTDRPVLILGERGRRGSTVPRKP
jgi:nucleotide-binding universal stress UspA family protein